MHFHDDRSILTIKNKLGLRCCILCILSTGTFIQFRSSHAATIYNQSLAFHIATSSGSGPFPVAAPVVGAGSS